MHGLEKTIYTKLQVYIFRGIRVHTVRDLFMMFPRNEEDALSNSRLLKVIRIDIEAVKLHIPGNA